MIVVYWDRNVAIKLRGHSSSYISCIDIYISYLFDQKYKNGQFVRSVLKHHRLLLSYSGWSTNDGSLSSAMARKKYWVQILLSINLIIVVRQND